MIILDLQGVINGSKHKGKTDRELAKEIGVSHVAIWKMRTGWKDKNSYPYNVSLEVLDRLCKFFKCDVGDIIKKK